MSSSALMDIYRRLYEFYGPQHWWPGDTTLEIIVGAILTQNTSWSNVEKAIANLKRHDCLACERLHSLAHEELALLIRSAGYYNIKAQRLKNFFNWLFLEYAGDIDSLFDLAPSVLRRKLLSIKGIGPETADSICLYAFNKPVFVVDAYTARVFGRHLWVEPGSGYEQIQDIFHGGLERDAALFNEFHALTVRLGKDHCKPRPLCAGCPLESLPRQIEPME
jgi:endonuclease III related protein